MWRKTRQPHPTSSCIGVDANRNFDSYWMQNDGASSNPCSEVYAGEAPWSEPETRALKEYLTSNKDKYNVYLAFHSYGQYLLSPYGHSTTEVAPNSKELLEIGSAFAAAIKGLVYGTEFIPGPVATTLCKLIFIWII